MGKTKNLPAGQNDPITTDPAFRDPVMALPDHERIDLALQQAAVRIAQRFMEFVELAAQAIDQKVHERFGYLSPDQYFQERVKIAPRTVYRWLRIRQAILALPPEEQPEAKEAMASLGSHKASVLVPVLEREGEAWREWVQRAETMTEEALQWQVSEKLGSRPRGPAATEPGYTFLRRVLSMMPPEAEPHVEAVFTALMRHAEIKNPVAAFLIMVDKMAQYLGEEGVKV